MRGRWGSEATGGRDGGAGGGAVAAVAQLADAVERSVAALASPALLQERELGEVLGALDGVAARTHALLVAVAREGLSRGLHQEAGFSDVDWVRLVCPGLASRTAIEIAMIARAAQQGVHGPLADAVQDGSVPVHRAAQVLRALTRIRPALGEAEYAEATDLLTVAAAKEEFDERDLAKITTKLVTTCLSEKEQVARAQAKHELRDVHESSLADGSLRRFVLTVGSDADYEAIKAVLMSPLAAPAPHQDDAAQGDPHRNRVAGDAGPGDGGPGDGASGGGHRGDGTTPGDGSAVAELDLRTAGQRRYDAFMTVFRRGVAGTEGQPTTPKAQVMVTIGLQELRGALAGAGHTVHDGTIPAHQVRQLACEADIIPAVLGEAGQILDLGRAKRLVTPGQRRALAHRDGGCTFPGCHVPATWCDAHHVVHWARGGRSDLGNYALLCPRHHTWVHQHDATADVEATGVRWRLR
ncbi:HNH endonuclease signature motif containing protein [uncultured Serinicoccus sp.]|uniref:HNH endonuclease signature motif containing protein n=1 Tax=uncultured Serinicoccus sp. TaxID=735514 RepID=UPI00261AA619|nr:HNH endonuclease signature motif containing protein [uncultured Serinicoccus sp.]